MKENQALTQKKALDFNGLKWNCFDLGHLYSVKLTKIKFFY